MNRLNPQTLDQLYREMLKFLEVRHIEEITPGKPRYPYHLLICGGTGCHASKSVEIKDRLIEEIRRLGLQEKALVIETGCNGFCAQGPVMVVYPGGVFYQYLKPEDAEEIIDQHVAQGNPVERLLYRDPKTGKTALRRSEVPFFALQEKRVLRNTGLIAAERIEEYIGTAGVPGRLQGPVRDDSPGDHRAGQDLRPEGARRGRVPDRSQVGIRGQIPGGREIHPLQRGRGGPGRLHGP